MSNDTTAEHRDDEGVEDFDAFWTGRNRKGRRVRLKGEVVELPPALPLQFELEARKLQRSRRDKDVTKLVAILFGEDAFQRFADAGMDIEEFQLLLAWAPRAIAGQRGEDGQPIGLAEVAAELAERDKGDDEGEPDPT